MNNPGASTTPPRPIKYHVFVSFGGSDTCRNFSDHLYSALRREGIVTFRDYEDLERGEVISEKLLQAIEQSLFAIVVLSKDYASSPWCLDELQKIIESVDLGLTVIPVFYDVDPSHIRGQKGDLETAFKEHEARFPKGKVRRWRDALTKIANLSGPNTRDFRHVAAIIEDIVKSVGIKLPYKSPPWFEGLAGDIQSKVDRIISLLKIGSDDKCFIGIWGMGGIGKTTLAKAVYEAVHRKFDAHCFLEDVRECSESYGLVDLQRKLLSILGLRKPEIYDPFHGLRKQEIYDPFHGAKEIRNFFYNKKVLIVLDDVSHRSQLENLAGNKEWFGAGSKIIITTRDIQLLTHYEQFQEYEVKKLQPDESLVLFRQTAFRKNEPPQGYLEWSKEVIEYACGVPLALKVLGSFLCGRSEVEWRDIMDQLKQNLPRDIFNVLRISYDGLDDEYRMMFLDIACFFNGKKIYDVANILKICGLHPEIGFEVLTAKSLLISPISNSISRQNAEDLDMHDRLQKMRRDIFLPTFMYHKLLYESSHESLHIPELLQEMGRNIVFLECPYNAGRRSRLWSLEDINLVLEQNMGTKKVKSIVLNLHYDFEANWHPDCFSKMQNLRLLILSRVHLSHNLTSLPSALRYLRWDCYALESLPSMDQLYQLESLQMCSSKIRKLWDGTLSLFKLRIIDLSNSDDLNETPDFSGTPNLEKLYLNYCGNLVRVHESVGQLKKLVELSLLYCINLVSLPTYLDMNNLEVFILSECSELEKLPEFSKNMRRLFFMDLKGTKITEIPSSIIHLINLKYLDLSSWLILKSVPDLPPNLFIRASKHPFWESTSDLQYIFASCVSKGPIHLFYDSKRFHFSGGEVIPGWFEQREHCHSKGNSSEIVTITADIPCDVDDYEGGRWALAVYIVFQCLSDAWRGFSINWKFQDYCHTDNKSHGTDKISTNAVFESRDYVGYDIDKEDCRNYVGFYPIDKEDCQPHPSGVGSKADSKLYFSTTDTRCSEKTLDNFPEAEIESRVYIGLYPIDKENCRQHPCGVGSQVDLTLSFPTSNTLGSVTIGSKKRYFRNLEIAHCGWRLEYWKKDLNAGSSDSELNRHETEVVEDSAKLIRNKIIDDKLPSSFEPLVGDIQSKVNRIIPLLKIGLDDKCFIGIWGIDGVGKTTLARVIYDAVQSKFDLSCFVANVREDSEKFGLVYLQKKILSNLGLREQKIIDSTEGARLIRNFLFHKKVLVVLDDVTSKIQLENLARNEKWFGEGSKIIITTRDVHLLRQHGQFEVYEVGTLDEYESLELLCRTAFRKEPKQDYLALLTEVVAYTGGLPLALKVLGNHLCGKGKHEWRSTIDCLRQNLHEGIFSALRISYDGLGYDEKAIFLDIACFFNREATFKVMRILKICGHDPEFAIRALIEKSLLSFAQSNSDSRKNALLKMQYQDMLVRIEKMRRNMFLPTYFYDWLLQVASQEYLDMHCLLQKMGRNIVFRESPTNAGKRSRLWSLEDINLVLKENKGMENTQSMVLDIQECFEADWHPDCFSKMINLRLLDLSKVHLLHNLNSLPSALKFLKWDYYALESLPSIDILYELESLQARNSKIRNLWNGTPSLNELRIIDLSDSECLIETPDFSATPNLEEFLLNGCRNLAQVHESVGQLKKLVKLSLEHL